jgi:hypothetical protein
MKNNRSSLSGVVGAAIAVSGIAATAFGQQIPRGRDVLYLAASCQIGPFPWVPKAGPYNSICKDMPDAEKCLALIKGQINGDFDMDEISGDVQTDKAKYCLELFHQKLGLGAE